MSLNSVRRDVTGNKCCLDEKKGSKDPCAVKKFKWSSKKRLLSMDPLTEVLDFLDVLALLRLSSVGWPFLRAFLKHRGRSITVTGHVQGVRVKNFESHFALQMEECGSWNKFPLASLMLPEEITSIRKLNVFVPLELPIRQEIIKFLDHVKPMFSMQKIELNFEHIGADRQADCFQLVENKLFRSVTPFVKICFMDFCISKNFDRSLEFARKIGAHTLSFRRNSKRTNIDELSAMIQSFVSWVHGDNLPRSVGQISHRYLNIDFLYFKKTKKLDFIQNFCSAIKERFLFQEDEQQRRFTVKLKYVPLIQDISFMSINTERGERLRIACKIDNPSHVVELKRDALSDEIKIEKFDEEENVYILDEKVNRMKCIHVTFLNE